MSPTALLKGSVRIWVRRRGGDRDRLRSASGEAAAHPLSPSQVKAQHESRLGRPDRERSQD